MPTNPVVVLPGITASDLRDEYAVSPETVWSAVLNKSYHRLTLHPDDVRYELLEPARIAPDSVFRPVYGNLIEELRHNLADRRDEPVPVFPFPYDWRQPLDVVERRLEAFIREVADRTSLLRHYHRAGYGDDPRVDLVGHSMGGLIIAGYLERTGRSSLVGKVATLGTPFRGSFEAPIKVVTGTANLGEEDGSASREREAARLTPALYHLLPRFEGALEVDEGLPDDLFSVETWQPGVIQTLAEFIRLHGLRRGNKGEREEWAGELLAEMLRIARDHRRRVERLDLARSGLDPEAWLCLVGVDSTTRVKLRIRREKDEPLFDLTGDHRKNEWGGEVPEARVFTGDGTVPLLGAKPEFLDWGRLVCLRPNDFGYWEIRDRLLLRTAGFHGALPTLNLAHRLIVSHFRGRRTKGVWGRPPPGVEEGEWNPPIPKLPVKP